VPFPEKIKKRVPNIPKPVVIDIKYAHTCSGIKIYEGEHVPGISLGKGIFESYTTIFRTYFFKKRFIPGLWIE
jgi:hypothetical protein